MKAKQSKNSIFVIGLLSLGMYGCGSSGGDVIRGPASAPLQASSGPWSMISRVSGGNWLYLNREGEFAIEGPTRPASRGAVSGSDRLELQRIADLLAKFNWSEPPSCAKYDTITSNSFDSARLMLSAEGKPERVLLEHKPSAKEVCAHGDVKVIMKLERLIAKYAGNQ